MRGKAPEWTRTTTEKSLHKALNLARLPIPPRAQRRASISLDRRDPTSRRSAAVAALVSVQAWRYSANTCSFQANVKPKRESSRHGSDQAPAGDIRVHPQVLREVRLSTHRARHRKSGRPGLVVDRARSSGEPREDRIAPPRPRETARERAI